MSEKLPQQWTDVQPVETCPDGYALGYRCPMHHAGEKRFAYLGNGAWECQGCRNIVPEWQIVDAQHGVGA